MDKNIDYFSRIQGGNGCKSKKEIEIRKIKQEELKHFYDTIDTELETLVNGSLQELIVIDKSTSVYKKKIISKPTETFELGDIVDCYGQKWLVNEVDSNRIIHTVGSMIQCNMKVRWINNKGKVVERYGYSEDMTKNNSGEYEQKVVTVTSVQNGIYLPYDEETVLLERGRRLMIEDEHYLSQLIENKVPIPVYKVTKVDREHSTYLDGHGVICVRGSEDVVAYDKDSLEELLCDINTKVEDEEITDPTILSIKACDSNGNIKDAFYPFIYVQYKQNYFVLDGYSDGDVQWTVIGEESSKIKLTQLDNGLVNVYCSYTTNLGSEITLIATYKGVEYNLLLTLRVL